MVNKIQLQELKTFTMTYRYFSGLLLLVSMGSWAQVPFEAAIKINQGISFLNDRPTDLPFLVDEDDSYNDIYFYNRHVSTRNLPGFEIYGGMKMHDSPIIFGMSLALNSYETVFEGNTTFSDGTDNGTFSLSKRGVLFSMTYRIGYRHNGFKTIRPFAYFDLGLMNDFSDHVINTEITYDGYDGLPDLNLYSSIELKRRMGISLGVEWRNLAFALDLYRMKEMLVYDGEGKDLPYNKRRVVSFGLSYIFKDRVYKSKSDVHDHLKIGYSKGYELVKRAPRFFTLFGGVSANIDLGGYGLSNSSLLNDDYIGDVSFMKVSRDYEVLSIHTTRENAEVAIMKFDKYSSENTGIPRFTLGTAFHYRQLEVDVSGHYFKFNNQQHYEYSYAKYRRYIIDDEPQAYTFEPNSFNYDYEFYLNNEIKVFGYTASLKYKTKSTETLPFRMFFALGWHTNYFRIKSTDYAQNHPAAVPLAEDLTTLFVGEEVDTENPSYYNLGDESYYLYDEDYLELLENPEARFDPLSNLEQNKNSALQKLGGFSFYFGFPVGRYDFYVGYEKSKTDQMYIVRSVNSVFIGVNYHLWGW